MQLTLPNQLTILRILLTPVFVVLFAHNTNQAMVWAVVVFAVASLTDWYDGWHARRFGVVTRWGTFLDPLADKILITSAFFAFSTIDLVPLWCVGVIGVRDIVITVLRSYAEIKDRPVITGNLAKVKTAMQMIFVSAVLVATTIIHVPALTSLNGVARTVLNENFLSPLLYVVVGLTVLTGAMYLVDNRKTLAEFFGLALAQR